MLVIFINKIYFIVQKKKLYSKKSGKICKLKNGNFEEK